MRSSILRAGCELRIAGTLPVTAQSPSATTSLLRPAEGESRPPPARPIALNLEKKPKLKKKMKWLFILGFLSFLPARAQIVIGPGTLPTGQVNTPYLQQLAASGGTGPYTFAQL